MRHTSPRKSVVYFQLEPELVALVDRLAERQVRSRSGMLRWLVVGALKRIQANPATNSDDVSPQLPVETSAA